MKVIVQPARPDSWNRRNRLINRQRTIWNRPKPEPDGCGTEPAQPGPWPSLYIVDQNRKRNREKSNV